MNFNVDYFKAKIWHGLKMLHSTSDKLEARYLEIAVCEAFGFEHKGDSNYYADGIDTKNQIQISVKTRGLDPHTRKRKPSRDFQKDPEYFLGPHQNKKHDRWTNGIEIVQRRQALPFNDTIASPEEVGSATISLFCDVIQESYRVYKTNKTYEVIVIHGYNPNNTRYLVNVYYAEYKSLDPNILIFKREGYGVAGYINDSGKLLKVMDRVNGNSKREATCFKEYKNLLNSKVISIEIPIPQPHQFNINECLKEITEYMLKN